jgi:hypothetical protein
VTTTLTYTLLIFVLSIMSGIIISSIFTQRELRAKQVMLAKAVTLLRPHYTDTYLRSVLTGKTALPT